MAIDPTNYPLRHQDILELVESLKVKELTRATYEEFSRGVRALFVPGIQFRYYSSHGKSSRYDPNDKHDWDNGKPEWMRRNSLTVKEVEEDKTVFPNDIGLLVHFYLSGEDFCSNHTIIEGWSTDDTRDFPTYLFAFEPGRSLYVADQRQDATPEFPWEHLYVANRQMRLL